MIKQTVSVDQQTGEWLAANCERGPPKGMPVVKRTATLFKFF